MQKSVRLTALSICALVASLHIARADPCDDKIKAWDKQAASYIDEGLKRIEAAGKMDTRAEETAELCKLHKWELTERTRHLAELKAIEATCGTKKKASYGVKDIERLQALARSDIAKTCK